jgi:hypothetical protein
MMNKILVQLFDLAIAALLVILIVLIAIVTSTAQRKARADELGEAPLRAARPGEVRGDFWSYVEATAKRSGADPRTWVEYPEESEL